MRTSTSANADPTPENRRPATGVPLPAAAVSLETAGVPLPAVGVPLETAGGSRRTAGVPLPAGPSTVVERWARRWSWALPAWAVLLGVSTLTHQPDPADDFGSYAAYVTTASFRLSHLVASITGAGIGIVGATALTILLGRTAGARRALRWLPVVVLGQALTISVFGAAAFAQPAIGRVHREGAAIVAQRVDELVYSGPLFATAIVGLLALIAGSVGLGRAVGDSGVAPTWAVRAFVAGSIVFPLAGLPGLVLQPIAGFVLAGASTAIVVPLRRMSAAGERTTGREETSPER